MQLCIFLLISSEVKYQNDVYRIKRQDNILNVKITYIKVLRRKVVVRLLILNDTCS